MRPAIGSPGVIGDPAHGGSPSRQADAGAAPIVTLTFDDGPSTAFTPLLLQILARENIKAAFFVLGQRVEQGGGDIIRSAHAQGHQIGNHSYNHPNLATLSEASVRDQLVRTQDLIGGVSSPQRFFRPPYGAQNATVKKVAKELGFSTVLWTADSLDWKNHTPSWIDTALDAIRPHGRTIVLNHDIHKTTVDNIPAFIEAIRKRHPAVQFAPLT